MSVQQLVTDRLLIVPMTYSMVSAILSGNRAEIEQAGIRFNGKWPLQDTYDILNFVKDMMPKGDDISGFDVWMVVKKEDMTVIGDAGFKGEPNEEGEVEIGFGLIEEEQRKGYGFEVANALIAWASQQEQVKVIKADCLIGNIGSMKILEKCGMCEISRDNELIYWEKKANRQAP